ICGVCPSAHHLAATHALDDLYKVVPTPTARAIREAFYMLFMLEDHALHFYYLAAPDFVVGPSAPPATRNVLGLLDTVDAATGKKVLEIRHRARKLMGKMGGKPIHPVLGLPGGVSKGVSQELRDELAHFADDAVVFAQSTLKTFHELVLGNDTYRELIFSAAYTEPTNYMGLVNDAGQVSFCEGKLRIVDPHGNERVTFDAHDYASLFAEHVEEWSYIKFPYLRSEGWKGFVGGSESGIVRVAPLARLNVAKSMATPLAQEEFERLFETLGTKPAHFTLATHWARLVELLYATERLRELAAVDELMGDKLRNMDLQTPKEGVGVVEAPRGTLIHHYQTDERGLLTHVNLMVATLFNAAPMSMSIERAARALIRKGVVNDGLLNKVEMAFRAYDPCLSCATHHQPERPIFDVIVRGRDGRIRGHVVREGGRDRFVPATTEER
ncbi:MAG: Ni/Fe hydrogenase subunit alpha, partial [Deltaproteobacteria bacterium]|nr:Ni/Fe hydrogenase subunit alpha [Deltaproteobacteria bacterium]